MSEYIMSKEKFEKSEFTSEEWSQYKSFLKETSVFKHFKEIGISSIVPNENLALRQNGRVQGYWEVTVTTLSGQKQTFDEYYGITYPGDLNLYKSCWIDAAKECFSLPPSPNHRILDKAMVSDLLTHALGFFSTQDLHRLNLVSKKFQNASEGIPRLIKINGDTLAAAVTRYPGATFGDLWSEENAQAPIIQAFKHALNQVGEYEVKNDEGFLYLRVNSQNALNHLMRMYGLSANDLEEVTLGATPSLA